MGGFCAHVKVRGLEEGTSYGGRVNEGSGGGGAQHAHELGSSRHIHGLTGWEAGEGLRTDPRGLRHQ